jgi:hypothetical protein
MIIVALKEGLGNQLFQYCFAQRYKKDGETVKFDTSFYSFNFSRTLDLNKFPRLNVDIYFPTESELDRNISYHKDKFSFLPKENLSEGDHFFDGYWHNKLYLSEVQDIIQDQIVPNAPIRNYLFDKYPFLFFEECVSIHVRRADYLNLSAYYQQLDIDYYLKALDIVGNNKTIVIFSDDIAWCKNNLKPISQSKSVHFISEPTHIDVAAMSLCSHNIIANSTFSFWGAYLNQNSQKIVVAPKSWYTKEYSLIISDFQNEDCASDIILDSWHRI